MTQERELTLKIPVLARVEGEGSITVGKNAGSGGGVTNSIAIGTDSGTEGNSSIAIGHGARGPGGTIEVNSIAIGTNTKAYSESVAIGAGANADQTALHLVLQIAASDDLAHVGRRLVNVHVEVARIG